jgi:DNA-binding beta-propeller fold protein YncE
MKKSLVLIASLVLGFISFLSCGQDDEEVAPTATHMYWTDSGTGKIQRANLDGSNVQDLVNQLHTAQRIALDVDGGKMYWTTIRTDKIQRANLDGSNVQDLVNQLHTLGGIAFLAGIALDVDGDKMYWIDNGTNKIQCANLDGSNVQDLITQLDNPVDIALNVPRR